MTSTPSPQAPGGSVGPAPGFTVGGYHLLTRIGEGGMGVVHLAQRPGGRRVALKVLRPHIVGDDEARARLAREVGSLSRIRSAGVAEIVDADPWGAIPYVATRYVPGLSLHDHVREEGPVAGADLTWFAVKLAEALLSVHEHGVLHRDVKPSNVLMEGRTPILIDFGLARVADDPMLTHTGWLLGTPGYLAPELLQGDDATVASDVHSWASTVAFAGLGRPPFGRGPALAVMDRVRRGEHSLDGLPEPVRSVVSAALDPEPSRRPSLPELLSRLQSDGRSQPSARSGSAWRSPDDLTVPYAVAALAGAHDETRVAPAHRDTVLGPTSAPSEEQSQEQSREQSQAPWEPLTAPSAVPAPSVWDRARRVLLLATTAWAAGAAVAAYPFVATLALVVGAWVLRSGSLAAGAASNRRMLRGRRRWYDGPQLLLTTPWHLVRSVPGTLLLALWGLGLAAAVALLGYAFGLGLEWTLLACGVTFAVGLWAGPGGGRVRGPVRWVLTPVTRSLAPWLVTTVLVLGLALVATTLVESRGPDWAPADDQPLSGLSLDRLVPGAVR